MNSIIGVVEAPLTVSTIEGDAILMHGGMTDDMNGRTVLKSVELLYSAFASVLENMVIDTICTCNPYVNIGSLDLKIVMHAGNFRERERERERERSEESQLSQLQM